MTKKITLATLKNATTQEVFTQVATHLLTQMKKSNEYNGGACLYRSPDNLMCAVGCLISDEEYESGMEGNSADVMLNRSGYLVSVKTGGLLTALQCIHDMGSPARWRRELELLAGKNKLQMPEIPMAVTSSDEES